MGETKLASKKIIVTGGAGFIGSHLVDALVDLDCEVIVIDDFSTGRIENLNASRDKIKILDQKLNLDSPLLKKVPPLLHGAAFIYHLAALPRIDGR